MTGLGSGPPVVVPDSYDIRPTLRTHPVPIRVIQGDHDYLDPGGHQWVRLSHEHPDVDVTVIDRAGHYSWIDDPEAFDRALTAALSA
ncbi:alpha/beta fold hydrolase [Flindersiella endophytica]